VLLVLEGSAEDVAELLFFVLYSQYRGGVSRFVPMVMVVERGDATGAFSLFQILNSVLQLISLHCIARQFGENDN
jgi:hypothetical protein